MKKVQFFMNRLLVLILVSSSLTGLPFAALAAENETAPETEVTGNPLLTENQDETTHNGAQDEQGVSQTEDQNSQSTVQSEPQLTEGADGKDENVKGQTETIPLQILGLNDFHGALATTGTAVLDGKGIPNTGKAEKLATHLNQAENEFKAKNPVGESIRVQAGDMVGASPANSALLQDEPTIRALNRLNITLGTLGNHEFDQGLPEFKRILDGKAPAPGDPAYNQITHEYTQREASKMEIVVGNVVNKSDGQIPEGFAPYKIETFGSGDQRVKVGFIGVVTTEFPNLVLKKHHENFNVLDEAETIVKYSKELREQGVNAIIVLGHVAATSKNGVAAGDAANVMAKVDQLDPENSVDAFFAGHNHQYTNGLAGKTRIVQSTSQGKAYIDLQGELDPKTGEFVKTPTAEIRPVTQDVTSDSDVATIVNEASEIVKKVTEENISTTAVPGNILRGTNSDNESVLGNLITDAQLEMANNQLNKGDKAVKVDFAMTNNGGIRADLDVKDDNTVTWGAAQKVQPFGNILQVVSLKGSDVKEALEQQYTGVYFLQIAGLTYDYQKIEKTPGVYETKITNIRTANGEKLDLNKNYNVVINDFLFGGGDGFSAFTKGTLVEAIDTDTNTFVNYFKMKQGLGEKIVQPERGRKNLVDGTTPPDPEPEPGVTEDQLKEASSIEKIYAGDQTIKGKTLPNIHVSYTVSPIAQAKLAPVDVVSDQDGYFEITDDSLDLKEGTEINVTFKASDTVAITLSTIVEKAKEPNKPDPEPNPDPDPITAKEIIEKTVIKPIYEGDKILRGTTIPNSTITYEWKSKDSQGKKVSANLMVTSDEKGQFTIEDSRLKLVAGDQVEFKITTQSDTSAVVSATVLDKKTSPVIDSGNGTTGKPTDKPTDKPADKGNASKPNKKGQLPKTNEAGSAASVVGLSLIMITFVFFRYEQKKLKK